MIRNQKGDILLRLNSAFLVSSVALATEDGPPSAAVVGRNGDIHICREAEHRLNILSTRTSQELKIREERWNIAEKFTEHRSSFSMAW